MFVGKFGEKLIIGESVDFSLGFCIYIGRKWFGLWVGIGVIGFVKVLIFVGFYDIRCDIWVFGLDSWKVGILVSFVGFYLGALKLS